MKMVKTNAPEAHKSPSANNILTYYSLSSKYIQYFSNQDKNEGYFPPIGGFSIFTFIRKVKKNINPENPVNPVINYL